MVSNSSDRMILARSICAGSSGMADKSASTCLRMDVRILESMGLSSALVANRCLFLTIGCDLFL